MTEFDKNKIRRLDLSVLLIFLGLMRSRKAADVAAELGLTNSSISHALRRLRDVFEDDLFLRRPHGLEPTAFAEMIEPDIRRAVEAVQSALAGPAAFDPATAEGTLRIAANDREVAGLIPAVFSKVNGAAPGLRFSVRHMSNKQALQELDDGGLDLAVGFFREPGPEYDRTLLRTETYSVVARAGHPIFDAPLTVERYAAAAHILVASDGSLTGIVDQSLADLNLQRRVCLSIPNFMPALSILPESDFIATLPTSLVRQHAALFGLQHCEPPLSIRPFDVSLLCHRRNRRDPMLAWCLERFSENGPR